MNLHDRTAANRMLDANLNRAFEGMRTLEDIVRFQNIQPFQSQLKSLRHELRSVTKEWSLSDLYASRNAADDVGREVKTPAERSRSGGLCEIAAAATQRVQQSLRAIEEIAKYLYPESASAIESIRYRSYDLNAQLILSQQRDVAFFDTARLYVLAHCQLPIDAFIGRVKSIAQAGASIIQIRDKQCDAQELIRYVNAAVDSIDPQSTRIILNDRADIVQCTHAWGLHVGQSDLSVMQSRAMIGPRCVVGLSTHDLEQVGNAVNVGADYLGCGPTFSSSTKSFDRFPGLDFLKSVAEFLQQSHPNLPAFAIGGIGLENLVQVLETGIRRVAVGHAIWDAESPGCAAEKFQACLDKN